MHQGVASIQPFLIYRREELASSLLQELDAVGIYLGGSLGEGPSYWNNIFSAGLGTVGFLLLWVFLELFGWLSRIPVCTWQAIRAMNGAMRSATMSAVAKLSHFFRLRATWKIIRLFPFSQGCPTTIRVCAGSHACWASPYLSGCLYRKWPRRGRLPTIENFTIVHATLEGPERWGYVFDKLAAASSLTQQNTLVIKS